MNIIKLYYLLLEFINLFLKSYSYKNLLYSPLLSYLSSKITQTILSLGIIKAYYLQTILFPYS